MTWMDDPMMGNLISTGDWWEWWARANEAADDLMDRCFRLHVDRGLSLELSRSLCNAGDLRLVEQCEAMSSDAIAALNSEYRSRQEP